MGLLDWFKREPRFEAIAPSPEHPTARSAVRALVEHDLRVDDGRGWVNLHADGAGSKAMIQTAQRSINLLKERSDLPDFLRRMGQPDLAARAVPGGRRKNDPTLWEIVDATPDEIALVVDLLFAHHFRLGILYTLQGDREG